MALGSGCLTDADVRALLRRLTAGGGRVVALTASARRLAGRNGLDAPRSVALGNVHHTFMQMLRAREAACRELASLNLDTTDTTPEQAAASVLREQDDAGDGAPAPDPRPPGAPGTPETARPDAGPSRSATA